MVVVDPRCSCCGTGPSRRSRIGIGVAFKEITDQMELARHGAHTFEGLLTRTVAAHTLLLTELGNAM